MQPATRSDIHALLSRQVMDTFHALRLDVADAQLSAPVDGPPRLRVSVRPGVGADLPTELPFRVHGRDVLVAVEATGEFQDYRPL